MLCMRFTAFLIWSENILICAITPVVAALCLDYTRPAYWAEDSQLKNCYCCEIKFDVVSGKVPIHHCRSCGNGVCDECSKSRIPVPFRGWDYPVRVCSICLKSGVFKASKPLSIWSTHFTCHIAILRLTRFWHGRVLMLLLHYQFEKFAPNYNRLVSLVSRK